MGDIDRGIIINPETAGLMRAHNKVIDAERFGGELQERAVLELAQRLADTPSETMAQVYPPVAEQEI